MSFKRNKVLSLAGLNVGAMSEEDLTKQFHESLKAGIHGFCCSPYEEGQKPGDQLSEAQIRRRLEVIKPHTNWIRTFSCTEGNELIARIAHEMGMKTMVGAWLGDEADKNEVELAGLIELAQAGYVDIAAVGNEVLYRDDLDAATLLGHIKRVKAALPDVLVGYVDAYYEFTVHPDITAACDVILANCYPFWEGCTYEYSLVYMKQMYQQAKDAAGDKPVIISETGWPSQGTPVKGSIPSKANAMGYFINAQQWAASEGIEIFYFSSFDESWKVGAEGDVGAYWGIWDKEERLKY
jgi:exo-beta-1,3-glucanase (GH17 family)